jgi:hypothetical protein
MRMRSVSIVAACAMVVVVLGAVAVRLLSSSDGGGTRLRNTGIPSAALWRSDGWIYFVGRADDDHSSRIFRSKPNGTAEELPMAYPDGCDDVLSIYPVDDSGILFYVSCVDHPYVVFPSSDGTSTARVLADFDGDAWSQAALAGITGGCERFSLASQVNGSRDCERAIGGVDPLLTDGGRTLVYLAPQCNMKPTGTSFNAASICVVGTDAEQVKANSQTFDSFAYGKISSDSSGRIVAIEGLRDGHHGIWMFDAKCNSLRLIDESADQGNVMGVTVSPDGRQMAIINRHKTLLGKSYLMRIMELPDLGTC